MFFENFELKEMINKYYIIIYFINNKSLTLQWPTKRSTRLRKTLSTRVPSLFWPRQLRLTLWCSLIAVTTGRFWGAWRPSIVTWTWCSRMFARCGPRHPRLTRARGRMLSTGSDIYPKCFFEAIQLSSPLGTLSEQKESMIVINSLNLHVFI